MNSTSQISSKTEQFKDTKSLQALNEFAKKIKVASDEAKGANVDTVALTTDPLKKAVPLLRVESFQDCNLKAPEEAVPIINTDLIFIPDWNNKPKDLPPVLSLNNIPVLTYQNTSAIIAAPGMGKSSSMEAIAASYLNPGADCLGFNVWDGCKGIIYIDFERTNLDVWNSFSRMCKRAGIRHGEAVNNVVFAGMRSIPRLKERLSGIKYLLQNNQCGLLLLDGAGDMVTDTNDLPQAIESRIMLRELTVDYQISILTTLHPNPASYKPRGHIGSEICRESECVLIAKKGEADCRIITSDFEYGKNRNNAPITSGYKWSEESKMFVSVDVAGMADELKSFKAESKRKAAESMAKQILSPLTTITHTQLIKLICQAETIAESTAKGRANNLLAWDIITKRTDGLYMLNLRGLEGQNGVRSGSD